MLLGNGQIFPPRFLFHGHTSPYTCILSMPANCPIRDDVIVCLERLKIRVKLLLLFSVKTKRKN